MAEGKYSEEKKDSLWKYYSETKKLLKEESYSKGKKNGVFKTFDEDGNPAKEENWKNDVQDGPLKEWYGKDQLKMDATFVNGVMDGKATYYFPDGKTSASGSYKKGVKDGVWKYSLNDGKSGSEELYKNGAIVKTQRDNGEFEEYYPKSNILKAVYNYKESKKNGAFKEYYEAGEWKTETVPAHDGFPEEQRQYFEGEKLQRTGNYKNDKLDGKVVTYKLDGTIEKTEIYKDGELQK
jgi:antitoxin component YwqK of YwqJK toxin-antitoxin module